MFIFIWIHLQRQDAQSIQHNYLVFSIMVSWSKCHIQICACLVSTYLLFYTLPNYGDFGKLDLPYSCTGIYFHYDIFFIVQLFDYLPFRLRILKLEMKILQIKGDDIKVCYSNCIFQSNSFRISQTLIPFLQSSPALSKILNQGTSIQHRWSTRLVKNI